MRQRLPLFGWLVLAVNIIVILWGAYVRATGSGAGCGSHWPLCNGDVIPRSPVEETVIEFVHRITSGVALMMVVGHFFWIRRVFPKGHRTRWAVTASLIFMIIEALIGAGLVLFELVGNNTSLTRALILALHLMNTFLLLGSITLAAWWSGGAPTIHIRGHGMQGGMMFVCLIAVILLGMSGTITALGDTLFPHDSFTTGIFHDFRPDSHVIARARFVHPMLAAVIGMTVMLTAAYVRGISKDAGVRRWSYIVTGMVLLQGMAGGVTILLLAPVTMQIIHLFLADSLWITMVMFAAHVLAQPVLQTQVYPASQAVLAETASKRFAKEQSQQNKPVDAL
jgi:heme A synthase